MKLLSKILGRAGASSCITPLLALFLCPGLRGVFLTVTLQRRRPADGHTPSLLWTLYGQLGTLLWASLPVGFLLTGLSYLRSYLHQTVANFQRHHGRITEANFNAVQT